MFGNKVTVSCQESMIKGGRRWWQESERMPGSEGVSERPRTTDSERGQAREEKDGRPRIFARAKP